VCPKHDDRAARKKAKGLAILIAVAAIPLNRARPDDTEQLG